MVNPLFLHNIPHAMMTAIHSIFSRFTLFNSSFFTAVQLDLSYQINSRSNTFSRMQCTTSNRPSIPYDSSLTGNQQGRCAWPGSIGKDKIGSNTAADAWTQNLLTMKFTRKSNGSTAAGSPVGASYSPATDQPTPVAAIIDLQKHPLPLRSACMDHTEEEAFRNFLLSRLPDVKAPQSLRQKIKSLIRNNQP